MMKKRYRNSDIEKSYSILARSAKHYQGGHGAWYVPAPLTDKEKSKPERSKMKMIPMNTVKKELINLFKQELDVLENIEKIFNNDLFPQDDKIRLAKILIESEKCELNIVMDELK